MLSKKQKLQEIRQFKTEHALDYSEENIITTMHLMNTHLIDKDSAFDQTSFGGSDNGIDGWHYDVRRGELFIYQSKLSENYSLVLQGFLDLMIATKWLSSVIVLGKVEKYPTNNAVLNLYMLLAQKKQEIKKIHLVLVSLMSDNDLEDSPEYKRAENYIRKSELYENFHNNGNRIALEIEEYNFDKAILPENRKYEIKKLPDSHINLRNNSHLDLAYIPLYNLVQLYRQRGDLLFHKNVRLSLLEYKDAKNRVVSPMIETLNSICTGKQSPNIFPFYHVGITLAATVNKGDQPDLLALESPYVINGCQTITIADAYLKEIEKGNSNEKTAKFKEINVIAKIVIGTTDDELREITNCNNRQNPIENWQLFSNDPIHIEIEESLKECGVFYDRQKGKFNALMKQTDYAKLYYKTNGTFLQVIDLGQIICLFRNKLQWAAKPSDIFITRRNHDLVFTNSLPKYPRDMILITNLLKAVKRALDKYIDKPAYYPEEIHSIFRKPIVRIHIYWIALSYYYQKKVKTLAYADSPLKIASPILVETFENFYQKIIPKTKKFYLEETKNSKDVSSKKLGEFFANLCIEVGIDLDEGLIPFSDNSINWIKYESKGILDDISL
jgi:hypothetical protein